MSTSDAPSSRILVVDDDADIRALLVELLSNCGYQVADAADGPAALARLEADDIDLMLLDLNLPGMTGYDVLRELNARGHAAEIAVICLSALSTTRDKVAGLELGAVDYVTKPFVVPELLARVAGALRAKATLDKLRSRSVELEQLSFTDPLTGLGNRRHFEERLHQEIARARREGGVLSCLMVDLDHFKRINDRYGHPAGDAVLREVARALRTGVRAFDTVARYGGEEFVLLLPGARQEGALSAAEALRQTIAGLRIRVEGLAEPISVTASIGVASFNGRHEGEPRLLEGADQAVYRAKRDGRNRVVGA